MSIIKSDFGTTSRGNVDSFLLDNGRGLQAEILTLGGTIRRLVFNGTDVSLGYDTAEEYLTRGMYFGALIGRNSNRIEDGIFEINGKTYTVEKNDGGKSNLHGGRNSYAFRIWDAEAIDEDEPKLILSLFSPDGDEGFPGNLNVSVTYTLTKENSLRIHYEANADCDTVINMTNHCYFNLNGHGGDSVRNHTLQMMCDFYTPNSAFTAPDGRILSVTDTPFDFTTPKKLDADLTDTFRGYDHNLIIKGTGFRKCAVLEGDRSGIVMETYTDLPGVQIFTPAKIGLADCKDGAIYGEYPSICLETQGFPNALKYSHFPSIIVKKGEKYDTVTEYKFFQK